MATAIDRLRRALQARAPRVIEEGALPPASFPAGGLREASALVPLSLHQGEPRVLLTLRRADLRRHAGQVSFPGGRVEPGEQSLAAALRESREEVGLDPAQVEVIGQLDELLVLVSGFRLTPWVGLVPDGFPYVAHPPEVERLIEVPLAALDAPGVHRMEEREVQGTMFRIHHYDLPEVTVWGATARALHQLLRLCAGVEDSA